MLRVAAVRPGDVLYDLGCGDGRIVIAAAERFGIQGLGVDNDPARIAEAHENARAAGVSDRVRFIQGDVFDVDLSPATVVMLYLLQWMMLELRPKLFSELRSGSRIVSHNYHLGESVAQSTTTMIVEGKAHQVLGWTVP